MFTGARLWQKCSISAKLFIDNCIPVSVCVFRNISMNTFRPLSPKGLPSSQRVPTLQSSTISMSASMSECHHTVSSSLPISISSSFPLFDRRHGMNSSPPLPEHRVTTLTAFDNFSGLSPRSITSSALHTPFTSPCSSPPPTTPTSGFLEEAKTALANAIAKRNTKSSNLTIDDDMRVMCQYYALLGTEERREFLLHLCTQHSTDHAAVLEVAGQRPDALQTVSVVRWEERLRQCLQPAHAWVLTQISRLTGGVKFLVDLRQDLLVAQSANSSMDEGDTAALKELDGTLREMLSLWFTVGLLQLSRITWESSCSMLQKISQYEAVHPVRNWTDLKRRVGRNRRCFVFTHSCMPNEPLVVLHTFLTESISTSMSVIVQSVPFDSEGHGVELPEEEEDTSAITAAIFYSITSTQKGLQGIELGNYIIKRVVQQLMAELPSLAQFSSLSPIPGYVKWLQTALSRAARGEIRLLTDSELSAVGPLLREYKSLSPPIEERVSPSDNRATAASTAGDGITTDSSTLGSPPATESSTTLDAALVYRRLRKSLNTNSWSQNVALRACLEKPFMRLCAHYLYTEKRRGYALNSVAHFHLKNGAVMWRLNYEADMTPRGLSNSCGIMVNYRYFLQDSEHNSRRYQETMTIAADRAIAHLATQASDVMNTGEEGVPSPA